VTAAGPTVSIVITTHDEVPRFLREAIESALAQVDRRAVVDDDDLVGRHGDCVLVYGAYRFVDGDGRHPRAGAFVDVGPDPYVRMLRGNPIGMHAAVMYRRACLEEVGGFDTRWRSCEDYDLYLRLARRHPMASGPEVLADYRRHEGNMSDDLPMMRRTALAVLKAHAPAASDPPSWHAAYAEGVREWKLRVRMGGLRRTTPISRHFGYDRGTPVDRRYVEAFLGRHAHDVRGRVLEVGDDAYTRAFGGDRVTSAEVLHVDASAPHVTYVADLADGAGLPSDAFDCVVLTQTLHLVFDMPAAIATLHRILKPGGVLLVTVPGVSSVDAGESGEAWLWSLTPSALRRLLRLRFAPDDVDVVAYGNVLTAVAFLRGLTADELRPDEWGVADPQYPVIVAGRAVKRC
jgi:SAM-dependent methyltransferase